MLSKQLESTLRLALSIANTNHHEYATLEHLLLALLDDESVIRLMNELKIDVASLHGQLSHYIVHELSSLASKEEVESKPTAGFQKIVHRAAINTNAAGWSTVLGVGVLAEFFLDDDAYAATCLREHGLTRNDVLSYISKNVQVSPARAISAMQGANEEEQSGEQKTSRMEDFVKESSRTRVGTQSAIESYCVNLNEKAASGDIDSLIGRETEIQRTIEILCRRQKNNAILVGEPGVGKTAIAEGLALRIVRKDVPEVLANSTIYALDLGSLVAGTRYRGDFEERIKSLIQEFKLQEDAILFVDEIHTMIGAGATAGGSLDASNLLKPALARGEIRCIGSTTFKEFRDHFEKDAALVRRFQKVVVSEPDEEATLKILEGLKGYYEKHHKVKYEHGALRAAVYLSERYITDKHLPDKAIDLMDEAGSRKKVFGGKDKTVTTKDIEGIVAMVAHLPSIIVAVDDIKKLQKLEDNLKKAIFGQDIAIEELCASIKLAKAGLQRHDRPTGCYLFAGNTGVGKTELAKQLAAHCSMELIRFDMSEYSESHAVSRLIGTPPGYVGFDQGGLLTEAVAKAPYSVVLFDEMEKADREIYNLLLQVMDRGILTDSTGKEINFTHTIIIMTTNAGAEESGLGSIGFNSGGNKSSRSMEIISKEFSPEFRSRLDNIIIFNPLNDEMIRLIIDKGLKELAAQLADKGVRLEVDHAVKIHLGGVGFNSSRGARMLRRIIDVEIKESIADEILFGKLKKGGVASVNCHGGKLGFEFKSGTKSKVMEEV